MYSTTFTTLFNAALKFLSKKKFHSDFLYLSLSIAPSTSPLSCIYSISIFTYLSIYLSIPSTANLSIFSVRLSNCLFKLTDYKFSRHLVQNGYSVQGAQCEGCKNRKIRFSSFQANIYN